MAEYAQDRCIDRLFERVSQTDPGRVAVLFRGVPLSYRELDGRANFVADHLRRIGVGRGDMVALATARSVEMIVAMLAVLKCGAAYLPLDAGNPVRRNRVYLDTAKVGCIIADHHCPELVDGSRAVVRTDDGPLFHSQASRVVVSVTEPDDPAYVMFTSGSSGKPKGVVAPHRAVARLVRKTNYIDIGGDDRFLQFSPPTFDASTFEIWGALLNGATLVLYSGTVVDPNLFSSDIRDNRVTIVWLTAALFHLIADKYIQSLEPVKVLLAGGDVVNPKYVNKVLDSVPGITVINGYGPTENTTFTCCHRMTLANPPGQSVPIGTPISGTQVHILDDAQRPVEPGAVGELYACGPGVALGYLDGQDKQDGFFVDQKIADGLIYRTGDLVRQNKHGEIEFVGRRDNQVKVRGYRVSLEEIEANLLELDHVNDAAVLVRKESSGDQLLVAYLKIDEDRRLNAAQVKSRLSRVLPGYMVPDHIVLDTTLPITDNGKIDRTKIQSSLNSTA